MKYLAGSSPLMGSRSAAGARAQQPKAPRADAELPETDFYFYFYFFFFLISVFVKSKLGVQQGRGFIS